MVATKTALMPKVRPTLTVKVEEEGDQVHPLGVEVPQEHHLGVEEPQEHNLAVEEDQVRQPVIEEVQEHLMEVEVAVVAPRSSMAEGVLPGAAIKATVEAEEEEEAEAAGMMVVMVAEEEAQPVVDMVVTARMRVLTTNMAMAKRNMKVMKVIEGDQRCWLCELIGCVGVVRKYSGGRSDVYCL